MNSWVAAVGVLGVLASLAPSTWCLSVLNGGSLNNGVEERIPIDTIPIGDPGHAAKTIWLFGDAQLPNSEDTLKTSEDEFPALTLPRILPGKVKEMWIRAMKDTHASPSKISTVVPKKWRPMYHKGKVQTKAPRPAKGTLKKAIEDLKKQEMIAEVQQQVFPQPVRELTPPVREFEASVLRDLTPPVHEFEALLSSDLTPPVHEFEASLPRDLTPPVHEFEAPLSRDLTPPVHEFKVLSPR